MRFGTDTKVKWSSGYDTVSLGPELLRYVAFSRFVVKVTQGNGHSPDSAVAPGPTVLYCPNMCGQGTLSSVLCLLLAPQRCVWR